VAPIDRPIAHPVVTVDIVPKLDAATRAGLPDRAFAYVDARGRRRLPIHDAAHVRNALARFGQVDFETAAARQEARERLLRAAQRFRIVPVGFITGELRSERGRAGADRPMPSGFLTMVLTDIEASTALVERLGDDYGAVLDDVRALLRTCATDSGGHIVEARADDSFTVFESPADALAAAVAVQRTLATRRWPGDVAVAVRIGIHSGYPTLRAATYIGMAVHTAARVGAAGHGGQIVLSGDTRTALVELKPQGVRFRDLGQHRLHGIPQEVPLFQVLARGLRTKFPPLRIPLT
jgi:class 3 adenylate cyclase